MGWVEIIFTRPAPFYKTLIYIYIYIYIHPPCTLSLRTPACSYIVLRTVRCSGNVDVATHVDIAMRVVGSTVAARGSDTNSRMYILAETAADVSTCSKLRLRRRKGLWQIPPQTWRLYASDLLAISACRFGGFYDAEAAMDAPGGEFLGYLQSAQDGSTMCCCVWTPNAVCLRWSDCAIHHKKPVLKCS